MSERKISVAVIGAGISGLAAIKEFVTAGFDVTAFEKNESVAGLWAYSDDPKQRSVAWHTMINSSKYMFCYSDFPMPEEYPPFVSHVQLKEYCELYCDKFNLNPVIKLGHEVLEAEEVKPDTQWRLKTRSKDGTKVWLFDKVVVAIGRHQTPIWPNVQGFDKFKGTLIHSSSYKRPEQFQDKTVLVVGVGNSALDCCVELSREIAKQTYISGRGIYIFPRVSIRGRPTDLLITRTNGKSEFMTNLIIRTLSWFFYGNLKRFGFGEAPKASRAPFAVNGNFVEVLSTGKVKVRPKLAKITGPDEVEFTDGTRLSGIDAIIMATGFRTDYPFLSDLKYSGKEKFDDVKYGMYHRFISLAAPHSLAFVGAILAPSLLPTICELQAQYLVRLWNGEITLPPLAMMKEEVDKHAELVEKTRYHKDDVSYIQFVPYLDGLAKQVGCDVLSRLTWGLWWRDRKLYNYIKKGPFSGHQYRLWGRGAWDGAREALAKVNEVP